MTEHENWMPEYLEFCEKMKLKPTTWDQLIFITSMTFQLLKKEVGDEKS